MAHVISGRGSWRPLMAKLHRYVGLAIATFLIVAGLTGSILAFQHELDAWLNPHLLRADGVGMPAPPSRLIDAIEQYDARAKVSQLSFAVRDNETVVATVSGKLDPTTAKPFRLGYSQIFLHPRTAEVLGTRQYGACCLQRENLIAFIYNLHFTLHMPGLWGTWLLGVIALAWIVDCFVGFYLTLPPRAASSASHPFRQRWAPAWKVKHGASAIRVTYDLHRAGGLWFWALLLLLAVSSLKLNLHREIFAPIVSIFSPLTPNIYDTRVPSGTITENALTFDDMYRIAQAEGARREWTTPVSQLYYAASYNMYGARYGEVDMPGLGRRWLYFDDSSGQLVGAAVPGSGTAGDWFSDLQLPLHSGKLIGMPGRILICITGLVVAGLSITGIILWWRKQFPRRANAH